MSDDTASLDDLRRAVVSATASYLTAAEARDDAVSAARDALWALDRAQHALNIEVQRLRSDAPRGSSWNPVPKTVTP